MSPVPAVEVMGGDTDLHSEDTVGSSAMGVSSGDSDQAGLGEGDAAWRDQIHSFDASVSALLETDTSGPTPPSTGTAEPWLLRPELEGMELPVARVKRTARELATVPVEFSEPSLFVFADEEGEEELVQVSLDIRLQTDDPKAARQFRESFFKTIARDLEDSQLARLSLFVWSG